MFEGFKAYLSRYVDISEQEMDLFRAICEVKSVDKKVRLTDLGEVEGYIYFVVKGLVRKYFLKGEEEIITHLTKEGEVLGSGVSFFDQKPSRYIVETIEPSVLIAISYANFYKMLQSGPKWQRVGRLLMTEFLVKKEYWLLDSIRYTPRERFLQFMQTRPDLLQRVPQKQLASFLNVKPETFSRLKHLVAKADK